MPADFTLTPLEKHYWDQLMDLFAQVNPQKPEIGCRVLIERARILTQTRNISSEEALADVYAGAKERTERRVALLNQCHVESH